MVGSITAACLYDILFKHIEAIRDGAEECRQDSLWSDEGRTYKGRVEVCNEILRFMTTIKDMVVEKPEPEKVCKHCGKVNGCPICSVHPADE